MDSEDVGFVLVALFVVVVGCSFTSCYFGKRMAYYNMGVQAAKEGVPVESWKFEDTSHAEFQWVVGWHNQKRKGE